MDASGTTYSLETAEGSTPLDPSEVEFIENEISADQLDPTTQSYFMRLDKKTVVKTEAEYHSCMARGIGVKMISYPHASHLVAEEEARERSLRKTRAKNKAARKARKCNR